MGPGAYLLHVTVVDDRGVAIADAALTLDGEPAGSTDTTGQYYLSRKPLPGGVHTLGVSRVGYADVSQSITLPASDAPGISIEVRLQHVKAAPVPEVLRGAANQPNYHAVRIFYATDREDTESADPVLRFANERSRTGKLTLGTASISIPRDHRPGELESPSWLHLEFHADPGKHIVLQSVTELEGNEFYSQLNRRVASSTGKEIVVFVHGYNNSFESAATTLAQFTYDLRFDGAPVLYSWPSKDRVLGYTADEDTVQWTAFHLREFLEQLRQQTAANTIHLIAHSMGNRALTSALQIIAAKQPSGAKPVFGEVVLAAPDIGADTLDLLANEIRPVAKRVTLSASANDDALMLSRIVHGVLRAGGKDPNGTLLIAKGIDTVDASHAQTDLLGHGYFDQSISILTDIHKILATGAPPDLRQLLPAFERNLKYWIIPAAAISQSAVPQATFH